MDKQIGTINEKTELITSGEITVTVPYPPNTAVYYTESLAHNLGGTPIVIAYVLPPAGYSGYLQCPFTEMDISTSTIYNYASFYVDDTNINFYVRSGGTLSAQDQVWTFKYFIFKQLIN